MHSREHAELLLHKAQQDEFALRAVARAGVDGLPVGAAARGDADPRADAVAVRARSDRPDSEGVVAAATHVAEEVGRPAVTRNIVVVVVELVALGEDSRRRREEPASPRVARGFCFPFSLDLALILPKTRRSLQVSGCHPQVSIVLPYGKSLFPH
jgi:hypothetical protein